MEITAIPLETPASVTTVQWRNALICLSTAFVGLMIAPSHLDHSLRPLQFWQLSRADEI
jgi:hypothetical protein